MSIVEVVVGKVARAHGLRGEVLVDVRTDEPARRFVAGTRLRTSHGVLIIVSAKWHGARLLTRFEGVDGRDAAEALRGVGLCLDVPADERPDDPEEFYDHQLVGLRVVDAEGCWVGDVAEVMHLPEQDVLNVHRDSGEGADAEILVPFVREWVPTVDLSTGRIALARAVDSLFCDAAHGGSLIPASDESPQR